MARYFIEPNSMHPNMLTIYKETDNSLGVKLIVYSDFDLAQRIVDILNKEEETKTENE